MSDNGKVIAHSNFSSLDPSDYDVNKTNIRLKDLDNTIKGRNYYYRNAIGENNIQNLTWKKTI